VSDFLFFLSKFLGFCASPTGVGLLLLLLAFASAWRETPGRFRFFAGAGLLWFVFWSLPATMVWLGNGLERDYPPVPVDKVEKADAIVILGGGMMPQMGAMAHPELFGGADRVWHAARLYKAGKAPLIIFSGVGEGAGARQFLRDLGVPAKDFIWEDKARNTRENIVFTKQLCGEKKIKKVLLVTSAFHMRRTMRTCGMAGFEVVPAATDHEALARTESAKVHGKNFMAHLPSADAFMMNHVYFKEHLGLWAMKVNMHGRP